METVEFLASSKMAKLYGHKNGKVKICLHKEDISKLVYEAACRKGLVAWDIETNGLDWKENRIGTCQLYVPEHDVHIIQLRDPQKIPVQLCRLLTSATVCKLFHHAMFDLRFMCHYWSVVPMNILCTKILSKILDPDLTKGDHSLRSLLRRHLRVDINKEQQQSNWLAERLTKEQIDYAASDVLFLPSLFVKLKELLILAGRWPLVAASLSYLPTRVRLELLGCMDVFEY